MWWRRRKKNICGYWDCEKRLPDNQFLCERHYRDWEEGTVDRCPKCGRFKDVQYYLCQDDYYGRRVAWWESPVAIPEPKRDLRIEFSEAWTDGFMEPERVFIYILEFVDGGFYMDYARDVRKRFLEHKEGKVAASASRRPQLKYVENSINLRAAELRLVELKRLAETNPEQVQLMFRRFRDHLTEFLGE